MTLTWHGGEKPIDQLFGIHVSTPAVSIEIIFRLGPEWISTQSNMRAIPLFYPLAIEHSYCKWPFIHQKISTSPWLCYFARGYTIKLHSMMVLVQSGKVPRSASWIPGRIPDPKSGLFWRRLAESLYQVWQFIQKICIHPCCQCGLHICTYIDIQSICKYAVSCTMFIFIVHITICTIKHIISYIIYLGKS